MKAFLLAAGKGKRLLLFTEELPKPLYKVLGKPLIQWNIEKLRDAGYVVDRVVAIVDRQEDEEADKLMKNADLELVSLYKLEELI